MNKYNKEQTLIPNGQIELMFLRICTDEQMQIFVKHVDEGRINLATAYASNIVYKKFFQLIEKEDK